MSRLPARVETPRLLLRQWTEGDAPALSTAITESLDHLRPWLAWATHEPSTLEHRVGLIKKWRDEWYQDASSVLGVFRDHTVVGATGLHRRSGPETLEIGYWIHAAHTGKSYATEVARALTSAAFTVPGVETVEIRTDKANVAGSRVPDRLGYTLADETTKEPAAPAEIGVDLRWVMDRAAWLALSQRSWGIQGRESRDR